MQMKRRLCANDEQIVVDATLKYVEILRSVGAEDNILLKVDDNNNMDLRLSLDVDVDLKVALSDEGDRKVIEYEYS